MACNGKRIWRMQRIIHQITRYPGSTCRMRRINDRYVDLHQHLRPAYDHLHKNLYGHGGSCPGDQQAGRPDDLHVYLCRPGSDQYRV